MKNIALTLVLAGSTLVLSLGAADAAERVVFVSPRAKVVSSSRSVTTYRTRVAIQKREGFEVGMANYACRVTRTKSNCQWTSWEPQALFAQCALKTDRLECRHRIRGVSESGAGRRSTHDLPSYENGGAVEGGAYDNGRRWYDPEDVPQRRGNDEYEEFPSRDSGYDSYSDGGGGGSDSVVLF